MREVGLVAWFGTPLSGLSPLTALRRFAGNNAQAPALWQIDINAFNIHQEYNILNNSGI